MSEMSDNNLHNITITQQAIVSCCGAVITSLFGKANCQACRRENLYKVINLQFDSSSCHCMSGL